MGTIDKALNKEDAVIPYLKQALPDKQNDKERKNCVHCQYEDANRTLSSAMDNNYPGPSYDFGTAIWCNYHKRYIGNEDRQALKILADGSVKENEWCKGFVFCDIF